MPEMFKDNKEFEFIKEQVLTKKRKKFKKWLIPFFMTILMAVIFGMVAAVTFCLAEPKLYKILHKDVSPSAIPNPVQNNNVDFTEAEENNNINTEEPNDNHDPEPGGLQGEEDEKKNQVNQDEETQDGQADNETTEDELQPVVVEKIDADIDDYLKMFDEIRNLTTETGKAIKTVSCTMAGKDWFGDPIEKRIYTSGVIIENTGTQIMLLVSLDRVKDASNISIEITDNISVNAVLYDYETDLNLAVLSVNVVDIPPKYLGDIEVANLGESFTLTVGSPIIAMGNPNGYTSSIDMGIVTSKGSTVSITDNEVELFNTNMTFNNESDGVIVNLKGEIIGLITRTLKNDLDKDLNTVIGISKIKTYIEKMIKQAPRVYCGVIAENLPQTAMKEYNVNNGIYIYEVVKDSPAFKAGLMSGDIIMYIDNRNIYNMNNFFGTISEFEPGTETIFKIKRTSGSEDKELDLKVILGEKNR